ncbi:hypothetical protein C8R41DRAFT_385793 [Lentinula lateritia]|uniref:F-box domain-containing protein n=1 Tax=Lentinula lateritia TaxID=40482 RepID=A0ABQ8VE01_9AGAR|nr:hypothetical protein C8R41DRAFT_385793 [Lentinula lateritia]
MAQYLSRPQIEGFGIWLDKAEKSFLKKRIFRLENHIDGLDDQLDELKRAYEARRTPLLQERAAKLYEHNSVVNLLAPIRRLSLDVLSEIFEQALFSEEDARIQVRLLCRFCRVSAAWRKAAIATPKIWSVLYFDIDKYPELVFEEDVSWVKDWICRSRGLPLNIHLNLSTELLDPVPSEWTARAGQILEYVLKPQCRSRIWTLNLHGDLKPYLPLFNLPRDSFTGLENLTIASTSYRERNPSEEVAYPFPHKVQTFIGALKLRHLTVQDFNDSANPSLSILDAFVLPMEQLCSLTITDRPEVSSNVYASIFHQAKNLIELRFFDTPSRYAIYPGFAQITSFVFPALRSLEISSRKIVGNRLSFLQCLTAPCLDQLTIRHFGHDLGYCSTDIKALLQRSNTSLSSLTLHQCSDEWGSRVSRDLIEILRALPIITSFRIDSCLFNLDELLEEMVYSSYQGSALLLPKLTHFEITYDKDIENWPSKLTEMILSRAVAVEKREAAETPNWSSTEISRLQKVTLHGLNGPDKDIARISSLLGLGFIYKRKEQDSESKSSIGFADAPGEQKEEEDEDKEEGNEEEEEEDDDEENMFNDPYWSSDS